MDEAAIVASSLSGERNRRWSSLARRRRALARSASTRPLRAAITPRASSSSARSRSVSSLICCCWSPSACERSHTSPSSLRRRSTSRSSSPNRCAGTPRGDASLFRADSSSRCRRSAFQSFTSSSSASRAWICLWASHNAASVAQGTQGLTRGAQGLPLRGLAPPSLPSLSPRTK